MRFDGLWFGVFLLFSWISYQDIRYGKIPNVCLAVLSGLLFYYLTASAPSFLPHLQAGLIGFCLIGGLLLFRNWTAYVGAGDLKLFALACFFTTPQTLPLFFISTGLLALGGSIVYKTTLKKKTFPLGPALMLGLMISLSKT